MKKILAIASVLLFVSCNKYSKDAIVGQNYEENNYYCLRIFENYTFFNNGAVKIYELKGDDITEKNIDSVNVEADKFIKLLNKKLD